MRTKDKIVSWEALGFLCAELHAQKARIVFTNGCFDILHAGHLQYLEQARALGDVLVVGLNSDASVSRLKGPERPIVSEQDRAYLLAGLQCVDYVTLFGQDTPYELIAAIQPDVLVKGGDWTPDAIVGADIVLVRGGEVLSLPFKEGLSTSELVRRIRGM
jgi:rfaE bifunctional protein nucleotidyltransferase chain/domain